MKGKWLVWLVAAGIAAGLLVSGVSAYAHHSFGATYALDSPTEQIEGKVVQFLMRNPHSFIHVQAPDKNGEMQRWSIEGGAAAQMRGEGDAPLQVGDDVQVRFNPARSPDSHRGRLVSIIRPSDGWSWGVNDGQVVN